LCAYTRTAWFIYGGLTDGQQGCSAVLEGTVLPCGGRVTAEATAGVIAFVGWQNPPARWSARLVGFSDEQRRLRLTWAYYTGFYVVTCRCITRWGLDEVYPHRRNYLRPRHPARDFVRRYASPRRNCERAGLCFFQPEIIMCFLSLRAQCFFKNLFIDFKFNDETTFYIEPPTTAHSFFKKTHF
jgi:hypothetical protein